MVVDPVTGAVIGWLVGQLGAAGKTRLGGLIGGDKQVRALSELVREATEAVVHEVAGAEADVLRAALLVEPPGTNDDEFDVVDLKTALGRLIRPKVAALTDLGYGFDADDVTDALFRHVMKGVQANAARAGPLAALAEFFRHERLATTGEQTVAELREIRRGLSRLQAGEAAAPNEIPQNSANPENRPQGLPGEVDHFVGRQDALAELIRRVDSHDPSSQVVAAHVLDGMPGVGKTAFVIHAAHALAARYPDGAMFVDLLGYSGWDPLSISQALTELLAQAGVPRTEIPGEIGPKQILWQRVMRRRRSLIVLDNARGADQVEPLLPEAPGCLVLITSRSKLYEISATPLHLQVLTVDDARRLFAAVAEVDRDQDPTAVNRIVAACDCLPLAIRLLAGRVRHGDPIEEIAHDVEQLPTERRIQGVFRLSYESLDEEARQAFRLLGGYPGGDITAETMAALADLPIVGARNMLRALVNNNLIDRTTVSVGEPAGSRYRLHDLLRDYARSVAAAEMPAAARQAAIDRLISHYGAIVKAVERLHHGEPPRSPATGDATFHDAVPAREWLVAERNNFLACIDAAPSVPADLLVTAGSLLQELCYWPEAARCHDRARKIYRLASNQTGEAGALRSLADIDQMLDRYEQAAEGYEQARTLFHGLDDRVGEAYALRGLADVDQMVGNYERASERYRQARTIARQIWDFSGEAYSLRGLADVDQMLGDYERAGEQYERALGICKDIGDRTGEASALRGLAMLDQILDHYERAAERYRQVLEICRDIGDRTGAAYALRGLADVDQMLDHYERASERYEQARTIFHTIGNRTGEASALRGLADMNQMFDRYGPATRQYEQARRICREAGDQTGEATALLGQAVVDHLCGRDGQAYQRCELAYTFFRRMDNRGGEAYSLRGLADIDQTLGRGEQAIARYELSRAICQDIGDRYGEATALRGLADVDQALGRNEQAIERYELSRDICQDIGDRYGEAEARWGLGKLAEAIGDLSAARANWLRSLGICESIASPLALTIQRALGGLD